MTVGEAMDAMYLADSRGVQAAHRGWRDIARMIDWVCDNWDQPDEGIWETRGGRKDFTYGRFQTWVALDRATRMATRRGRPANVQRWTTERDRVYNQIMDRGWNLKTGAFTQDYSTEVLDSSLLMMPLQGFVAPRDSASWRSRVTLASLVIIFWSATIAAAALTGPGHPLGGMTRAELAGILGGAHEPCVQLAVEMWFRCSYWRAD